MGCKIYNWTEESEIDLVKIGERSGRRIFANFLPAIDVVAKIKIALLIKNKCDRPDSMMISIKPNL